MNIEIDLTVLKIALPIGLIGFCFVWFSTNFWCALGVSLIAIASGVKRSYS